jgi:hypothetical protein
MSNDPIGIFIIAYNYAGDFINNISKNYPNFSYSVSVLYVTSIILELISKHGRDNLREPDFNDNLIIILTDKLSENKNLLRDSYTDIISSLSDNLIDYFSGLDDIDQLNIISDAIDNTILGEADIYDNTGLNIIITRIEPYVTNIVKDIKSEEKSNS